MRFLVTGGAGFIGCNLVRYLLSEGHQVRVVDDLSAGKLDNLAEVAEAVEFHHAAIEDFELMKELSAGIDGVFHLAAVASVQKSIDDPAYCHGVNVTGTLNVLEAARRNGIGRVVLSSSAAVYGEATDFPLRETEVCVPISPYGLHKLVNEQYGRLYTLNGWVDVVALRYFNVFGPRQDPNGDYAAVVPKFITAVVRGTAPTIFGDGGQSRDFMYVRDVAKANLLAMTGQGLAGEVINVCAGREASLLDLVKGLSAIFGYRIEPVFGPARLGDIRRSVGDCSNALELLGIDDWISVEEGLAGTCEWYRDE